MVGNGGCENSFGREISREKRSEIAISTDAVEILTEKGFLEHSAQE